MSDQGASGESDYIVTPDGSTQKPSLFGKLKDKTKKAGSRIKSKVTKKNPDGTPGDHEEEDDTGSDDTPVPFSSPVSSTPRDFGSEPSRFSGEKDSSQAPDISGLSLNEPTPTPTHQEPSYDEPQSKSFGERAPTSQQSSYDEPESKPVSESKSDEPETFQDSSQESSYDEPSATDKASGASEGAKDALYGGAAAAAGAVGYKESTKDDDEKPFSEKASDATDTFGSKAEDAKDTVARQTEDTFGYPGGETTPGDKATEAKDAAYSTFDDAKGTVESKADDVNNATDDSQTYTEKASNSAQAAKESAAGYLGMDTTSGGPSLVDQAKQTLGFGGTPSGDVESKAAETTDAVKSSAYDAKDAAESKAADVNNNTGDSETFTDKATNVAKSANENTGDSQTYTEKATNAFDSVNNNTGDSQTYTEKATNAFDSVNNNTGDPQTYTEKATNAAESAKASAAGALGVDASSQGPSLVEKAKETAGFDSEGPPVTDTVKEKAAAAVDTTKAYAADATSTAQDYAAQAKGTATDIATPKDEDKALSEKITDTLGGVPASVTDAAKSMTSTSPGAHGDEPASPGILGKLGGLFGYAAKAPEHHDTPTTNPTTPPPTTTTPQ